MKKIYTNIALTLLLAISMKGFAQFSGGTGTAEDPYIISTVEDLSQFATYVNANNTDFNKKCYELSNDINLAGIDWTPIGYDSYAPFRGVFDGNNKKITGLTINSTLNHIGLFGNLAAATVKNLGVTEINITTASGNDYAFVGGVASFNRESVVSNCYTTGTINSSADTHFSLSVGGVVGKNYGESNTLNCYSTVSITATSTNAVYAGGVVGNCETIYGNDCIVSDSYFSGMLSASGEGHVHAGGVVGTSSGGYAENGCSVLNCYSTASINATQNTPDIASVYAGGVVGNASGGRISKCYSTGIVNASSEHTTSVSSANAYAGGVAGSGGNISNCYATASVTAFATSPTSPTAYAGGIAGSYGGSDKILSNCYATGLVSATTAGSANVKYGYAGGIVGSKGATGDITNCAALNPAIICEATKQEFGRVAGNFETNLSYNIGFINMLNPDGNILWHHEGHDKYDGAGIGISFIHEDGTLGGRFTSENGWITQNGKLPGLFGQTVNMPIHLGGVGVDELQVMSSEFRVYPNPTTGELRIENGEWRKENGEWRMEKGEWRIENIEIFDVFSRKLSQISNLKSQISNQIDISHLPAGIYFVKIRTETGEVVKKVVKE